MKGKSDDDASSVGGSILNNTPLDNLLTRLLDYDRIATNIQRGKLRAISVSASCYSTHQSINFFQAHPSVEPWSRAKREGRPANLNTQHLLASSAIPFIFRVDSSIMTFTVTGQSINYLLYHLPFI